MDNSSVRSTWKKRTLSCLAVLTAVVCILSVTAGSSQRASAASRSNWDGSSSDTSFAGSGTAASPYLITSAAELHGLAVLTTQGSSTNGKYYLLTTDIDLQSHSWTPIGIQQNASGTALDTNSYWFGGTFIGGGHTVYNLAIGSSSSRVSSIKHGGLFGIANSSSYIYDLGVDTSVIYTSDYTPSGDDRYGGFIGYTAGYVFGCFVKNVTVNCSQTCVIGGFCGQQTNNSIYNCYAYNVTLSVGSGRKGGFIGDQSSGSSTVTCWSNWNGSFYGQNDGSNTRVIGQSSSSSSYTADYFGLLQWDNTNTYDTYWPRLRWESNGGAGLTYSSGQYQISSLADFLLFRDLVNAGYTFAGASIVLNCDIDLSGQSRWYQIGALGSDSSSKYYFAGSFNGNGYTVSNMHIGSSSSRITESYSCKYAGLFGLVSGGSISNLYLKDSYVYISHSTDPRTGGLIGYEYGASSVSCCKINNVTVSNSGSGVAGVISGETVDSASISDCYVVSSYVQATRGGIFAGDTASGTTTKNCYSYSCTYSLSTTSGGSTGQSSGTHTNLFYNTPASATTSSFGTTYWGADTYNINSGNIILYWETGHIVFTVRFTTPGSSASSVSAMYMSSVTLPSSTLAGYTFCGWYHNSSFSGTNYAAGSISMSTLAGNALSASALTAASDGSRTIIDLYTRFSKTITGTFWYLDSSGAKTSSTSQITVYSTSPSGTLSAPSPASVSPWTYLGWRTDTTAGAKSVSGYTVSADTTYYAVYSRGAVLSYDANSGSGAPSSQSTVQYMNANGGISSVSFTVSTTVPTKTGYTFSSWNTVSGGSGSSYSSGTALSISTASDVTLYAQYTVNSYDITFVVDGTSHTQSFAYGATPTYTGSKDKAADAQYTYTFTGWDPEIAAVTGTATYTAQYSKTVNNYDITFVVDGTSHTQSFAYGATPAYTGSKDKAADAQYTYTFTGWDPEIAAVTGTATYTAQYSKTVNNYDITFVVDGTSHTQSFAYGATPAYTGSKDKAADAQYTYTFTGWDPEIAAVTGTATYTAQYSKTVNNYDITFVVDGTSHTQSFAYGATPTYTGSKDKAADAQYTYTFTGWDPEIAAVTGTATYTAQYSEAVNSYDITFVVDGTTHTQSFAYGATPTYTGSTDKAADAQYTYTFTGWSPALATVTGAATYTAQYSETVNSYDITFVVDGTTHTQSFAYGATPTYTGSTDKASNAQYTYTFTGWDPEIAAVTGAATYTAQYSETVNSYDITFVVDGTSHTQPFAYGSTPTYTGSTDKASDADNDYTFSGWTPEIAAVTGEAAYTAVFTATPHSYSYLVTTQPTATTDGLLTGTCSCGRTTTVIIPAFNAVDYDVVTQAASAGAPGSKTYTWKLNGTYGVSVTGTVVIPELGCTVTFYDENETAVLDTRTADTVEEALAAYAGAAQTKAETAQYSYTFNGWTVTTVDENAGTYKAVAKFAANVRSYDITFVVDGTANTQSFAYGSTPAFTGSTDKAADAQYTYTFTGWDPEIAAVTGTATYTAQYSKAVNNYDITFVVDGTSHTQPFAYGATPSYTGSTDKAADAQYTYTFTGWSPEIAPVTGTATYTAQYSKTVNNYDITFVVDGTSHTQSFAYGATPAFTGSTDKAADAQYTYTFTGWDPEIAPVTGTATYTAQYSKSALSHVVNFYDADGNFIATAEVSDPSAVASAFTGTAPVKAADAQYTYTFSGWAVTEKDGIFIAQPQYTGTLRKYTVTFVNNDGTVLYTVTVDYGTDAVYAGDTPVYSGDGASEMSFTGWSAATSSVKNDIEVTAQYKQNSTDSGTDKENGGSCLSRFFEKLIAFFVRLRELLAKLTKYHADAYNVDIWNDMAD